MVLLMAFIKPNGPTGEIKPMGGFILYKIHIVMCLTLQSQLVLLTLNILIFCLYHALMLQSENVSSKDVFSGGEVPKNTESFNNSSFYRS